LGSKTHQLAAIVVPIRSSKNAKYSIDLCLPLRDATLKK
jgi:hypothetical protein